MMVGHCWKLLSVVLLLSVSVSCHRLPYIVGGENVDSVGKWPWQGSLQVMGLSHFCGCVVISKDWLLTASSCFLLPSMMTVVLLGAHDVRTRLRGEPTYYTIQEMIKHPDFSTDDWEQGYPNDIGLIRLKSPANLDSTYIAPIDLASDGDFSNTDCYMTGWGFTLSGLLPPNVLKEAPTRVLTNMACDTAWPGLIHHSHLCVGGVGQEGACSGDSGGPIVCKKDDRWLLVAITSWGMNTCDTDYPTVCTRVSSFRQWIAEATKGDIPM